MLTEKTVHLSGSLSPAENLETRARHDYQDARVTVV